MIFISPYNPNSPLAIKDRKKISLPITVLIEQNKLHGKFLNLVVV